MKFLHLLPDNDPIRLYVLAGRLIQLGARVAFMESPIQLVTGQPVVEAKAIQINDPDTLAAELMDAHPGKTIALYQYITDPSLSLRYGVFGA